MFFFFIYMCCMSMKSQDDNGLNSQNYPNFKCFRALLS